MAITDAAGRFAFDSGRPATQLFIHHAVFDSIGISGLSVPLNQQSTADTIHAFVPSFQRLWSTACKGQVREGGRGFLFGTVLDDSTHVPARNAAVIVRWSEIALGGASAFSQHAWRAETATDSSGTFVLCNVPVDVTLSVSVFAGKATTGLVSVLIDSTLALRRQDLTIGGRKSGVVAGVVRDETGKGVADARLSIGSMPESRTRSDGSFRVFNVPSGTQQLEVLALGSAPNSRLVDVLADDTVRADFLLNRAHLLDSVTVVATSVRRILFRDVEDRRRAGFGHFRDSTELARLPRIPAAFEQISGVKVSDNGMRGTITFPAVTGMGLKSCTPTLWIDNHNVQAITGADVYTEIKAVDPSDAAVMEVYVRATEVPPQFVSRRPGLTSCGAIVLWTKRAQP